MAVNIFHSAAQYYVVWDKETHGLQEHQARGPQKV